MTITTSLMHVPFVFLAIHNLTSWRTKRNNLADPSSFTLFITLFNFRTCSSIRLVTHPSRRILQSGCGYAISRSHVSCPRRGRLMHQAEFSHSASFLEHTSHPRSMLLLIQRGFSRFQLTRAHQQDISFLPVVSATANPHLLTFRLRHGKRESKYPAFR